ncbi:hypothetical protein, partial [Stenotrophomonas acidaminiphila]|uniref:hypothetical protein n=1 Tax=Stenotrophomonas acidaminiphila TaxID=128780 RepID=UPI00192A4002
MTPLSLGAASASQAPGAASPPRAGSGADKDAAGFDALLQAFADLHPAAPVGRHHACVGQQAVQFGA